MDYNLAAYSVEIVEFLSVETLVKIDYGILDLSHIENVQLREVLCFFSELLRAELKRNYLKNATGLFRVRVHGGKYCYEEFGHVIEADTICELEELVLEDGRIWYVFDEISARNIGRR